MWSLKTRLRIPCHRMHIIIMRGDNSISKTSDARPKYINVCRSYLYVADTLLLLSLLLYILSHTSRPMSYTKLCRCLQRWRNDDDDFFFSSPYTRESPVLENSARYTFTKREGIWKIADTRASVILSAGRDEWYDGVGQQISYFTAVFAPERD